MEDKVAEYGKEFWTLANLIVGFVIVQTLALVTSVAADGLLCAARLNWQIAVPGVIFATALYLRLLRFCHRTHYDLVESKLSHEGPLWRGRSFRFRQSNNDLASPDWLH